MMGSQRGRRSSPFVRVEGPSKIMILDVFSQWKRLVVLSMLSIPIAVGKRLVPDGHCMVTRADRELDVMVAHDLYQVSLSYLVQALALCKHGAPGLMPRIPYTS